MRTSTSLAVVLLLGLSACGVSSDQPDLWVYETDTAVKVTLVRGWDHDLTGTTATVNGIDAGTPLVEAGRQGRIGNPATSATAELTIPSGSLGTAIHAEVDDHGEIFTFDAPDLGVRRELQVISSFDHPLTSADTVSLSTNRDTDVLSSGTQITFQKGDQVCTWATRFSKQGTAWVFSLTPDFSDWYCGARPAAGSVVDVVAHFNINVTAPATCPDSTCTAVTPLGGGIEADMPARLQF